MVESRTLTQELREFADNSRSGDFINREFSAGTVLLHAGDVADELYLINRGCVRLVYNDGEREVTLQFFTENELVSSIASFYSQTPSDFSLVCVEDTQVLAMTHVAAMRMITEQPAIMAQVLDAVSRRLGEYTIMLAQARTTPTQQYAHILQTSPGITERLPQTLLASYLGISPVSLSRIRKRMGMTTKTI